jgi:hypothetical protein
MTVWKPLYWTRRLKDAIDAYASAADALQDSADIIRSPQDTMRCAWSVIAIYEMGADFHK